MASLQNSIGNVNANFNSYALTIESFNTLVVETDALKYDEETKLFVAESWLPDNTIGSSLATVGSFLSYYFIPPAISSATSSISERSVRVYSGITTEKNLKDLENILNLITEQMEKLPVFLLNGSTTEIKDSLNKLIVSIKNLLITEIGLKHLSDRVDKKRLSYLGNSEKVEHYDNLLTCIKNLSERYKKAHDDIIYYVKTKINNFITNRFNKINFQDYENKLLSEIRNLKLQDRLIDIQMIFYVAYQKSKGNPLGYSLKKYESILPSAKEAFEKNHASSKWLSTWHNSMDKDPLLIQSILNECFSLLQ